MLPDIETLATAYLLRKIVRITQIRTSVNNYITVQNGNKLRTFKFQNPRWIDKLIYICKKMRIVLKNGDDISFTYFKNRGMWRDRYYRVNGLKLVRIKELRKIQDYKKTLYLTMGTEHYFKNQHYH